MTSNRNSSPSGGRARQVEPTVLPLHPTSTFNTTCQSVAELHSYIDIFKMLIVESYVDVATQAGGDMSTDINET
jgi:hypothetical protein